MARRGAQVLGKPKVPEKACLHSVQHQTEKMKKETSAFLSQLRGTDPTEPHGSL